MDEPEPLEGFLLKDSLHTGATMRRSYIVIDKGRVSWSLDRGAPVSGEIDLSSPCEVFADKGTRFILRPLGGSWKRGNFNGMAKGRSFVFDANREQSDHTAETWVQALKVHIQYASSRCHKEYSWMWADAGFIPRGIARLNPGRWSGWKDRAATLEELKAYRTLSKCSRSVEMKICHLDVDKAKRFSDINRAIQFLSEEQEADDRVSLTDSLEPEKEPRASSGTPRASTGTRRASSNTPKQSQGARVPFTSFMCGDEIPVLLQQAEGYPTVRVFVSPKVGEAIVAEIESGTEAVCLGEWGEFLRVQWKQLEGWVGRKNVKLASGASFSVSPRLSPLRKSKPVQPADTSPSKRPGSPNPLLRRMSDPESKQFACMHVEHKPSEEKYMETRTESIEGTDTLFASPVLTLKIPVSPPRGDLQWSWGCVEDVVAAMSASGATIAAPEPLETPTPVREAEPDEAKILEAQSLLASMLTPPDRKGKRSKHRQKSLPPPSGFFPQPAGQSGRRALSTDSRADALEALQPLNGSMPWFPSIELDDESKAYKWNRDTRRSLLAVPRSPREAPLAL